MADLSGIQQNSSVMEQLSINRGQKDSKKSDDKTDFLTLMVAQLENQNPLEPQENGEFLSQLAQFNTVDGIERLNTTMFDMADSFRSSQTLQATALVGRSVQIEQAYGELSIDEQMKGSIALPFSASNVKVDVFSSAGELVRTIPMGFQSAGDVPFSWDGIDTNGNPMPAGRYRVAAHAINSGESTQLATYMNVNVDSVTLGGSGGVTLNIAGVGSVPLERVRQIN